VFAMIFHQLLTVCRQPLSNSRRHMR